MLPSCTYEFTSRNPLLSYIIIASPSLFLSLCSSLFLWGCCICFRPLMRWRWKFVQKQLGGPLSIAPSTKKKKNTDNRDYAELVACCLCSSSCCYWCNSCCCRGLMGYSAIRTAKWGRQGDIDASICEYIYYCSCVRWHIESD